MGEVTIEEKVKKVIQEQLAIDDIDINTIKYESHFANDLSADSLDQIELISALEDAFKPLDIPDAEARKITTVGQAIEYIKKNYTGTEYKK